MPSTQDKRDIVINTKLAATGGKVSQLDSTLDIVFTSDGGTTIKFKDDAASAPDENSTHQIDFLDATGTKLATLGVEYLVSTTPNGSQFSVTQTLARSTFNPASSGTNATLPRAPQESFTRTWQQPVTDAVGAQAVLQASSIDSRFEVEDPRSYSTTQSIQSSNDNTVVLAIALLENTSRGRGRGGRGGAAGRSRGTSRTSTTTIASGTVTFTTTATASAGYALGSITVVDS